MNDLITIRYKGKEYWYYPDDITSWWDEETWEKPMYASAVSDDGFYTIEWDEDGNIVDITKDFE